MHCRGSTNRSPIRGTMEDEVQGREFILRGWGAGQRQLGSEGHTKRVMAQQKWEGKYNSQLG